MFALNSLMYSSFSSSDELNFQNPGPAIFELFFCKKIPLSRRVEYVMDRSMDHSVSERCMYVTPIRSDLL